MGNMGLLALKVKDLDAGCSCRAEPVAVGGEDECIDNITCLQRVEVLALVEVPKHGYTILATRRCEGAIGRDRDSVDVASMDVVVGLELELRKLPDLSRS